MRPTPDNIKAILAQKGYGAIRKAIRASYWDLFRGGYNRHEMKDALSREFGTEDEFIRSFIYHEFFSGNE